MLGNADIYSLDARGSRQQTAPVVRGKDGRRRPVAAALGLWLQYLRKQTGEKQLAAAQGCGLTLDAIRRVERGENVGAEILFPFLSWLDEELSVNAPSRHQELRDGLFERLIETGTAMRRAEPRGDQKPQPLPRAAVGERGSVRRKTHRTR